MPKRILVFPCGSEIGLEIHRSLRYSMHFELVGASSVDDHGRFVFDEYVGGLPFHTDPGFPAAIRALVREHRIDAIYPAMDAVADTLCAMAGTLGAIVVGSPPEVTAICASKSATYDALRNDVPVPALYDAPENVPDYPVFIKPDRGYGARNTLLAQDAAAARSHLARSGSAPMLLLENLPGPEWTIDCFSDRNGRLRFSGARLRGRISNGISVHTRPSREFTEEFSAWAERINRRLGPRGAWFFQAKLDGNGHPKLLEVAARLGGSSGLFRGVGVNFALLSVFDAFGHDVTIRPNDYGIEMDRALASRYRITADYGAIYVDLDDCLIFRGAVNHELVALLYKAVAERKKICLITRHHRDPRLTLREHRIADLFDRIIHLTSRDMRKSDHIDEPKAIFIDDSHAEREEVASRLGIPVFSPDMVEVLF